MKANKVYCYSAIMSALMKFYSIHDLAKGVEEISEEEIGTELNVYTCKSDGFILRRKKDNMVSDADLVKALIKVIKKMIKDEDDSVESYIFEQYDFEMKDSMICADMIEHIFEIAKNGRLITVEMDI